MKIRTDKNQQFDRQGNLVREDVVQVDITPQWVTEDLRTKGLAAITANQVHLALASPNTTQNTAQIKRLTRECNALIRLILGGGLKHLQENPALLDDTATDT